MRALLLFGLCLSALAGDCISKPCSTAANFSYDLLGTLDDRPDTWGLQGWQAKPLVFAAPAGYSTQILRVHLNFIGWPRGTPAPDGADNVIGHAAGMLLALCSTAGRGGQAPGQAVGSPAVAPPGESSQVAGGGAADNCFVFEQMGTKGESEKIDAEEDTSAGGTLAKDNTMNVTGAVFLNTLGLAIHLEASMVIVFRYVKITQ